MVASIVSVGLKAVILGFAFIGLAALLLAGMIASPVRRPPELMSVSKTAGAVDRSTMPGLDRFHARDGTELAYRHYPARSPATGQIAIVVHGSSGSSVASSTRCPALWRRGVETYAVDIRGHGASGTRGDIAYVGQLEDDLADFVAKFERPAHCAVDADRPFGRRRLRAACRGFADPEPVRAHHPARPLSRLQGADQSARTPAAGPAPMFRVLSVCRSCAASVSIVASRCRCSLSRSPRIRSRSWCPRIAIA